MQRENHRDRRPYRIFHPLSHRVQKNCRTNIAYRRPFTKKVRHANVLAGPTQERAGRKRTGGTPCLYPLCPLKRIGNKFRHAGRTDKHSVSVGSSLRPKWPLLKNRQDRLLLRRTFRQATNLCSRLFSFRKNRPIRQPSVHRKALWQTHSARKSAAYPYAPSGRASAHKNSYSVCRAFPCRAVSPSGSGSTPRISETVCPRRAFEPAGTDWLRTVPAPENETIIP